MNIAHFFEINSPVSPYCLICEGLHGTRRLAAEGRLHIGHDLMKVGQVGDQCSLGCNFDTKRPLRAAEAREPFWNTFVEVAKTDPNAVRYI